MSNLSQSALNNTSQVTDITGIRLNEPVVVEFYLGVTRCPDGVARNAMELRTRGHEDWPEITCWPKHEHNRLTTGREYKRLGSPEPVKLNDTEKQICAILGLEELELHVFLREWTPQTWEKSRRKPRSLKDIKSALEGAQ